RADPDRRGHHRLRYVLRRAPAAGDAGHGRKMDGHVAVRLCVLQPRTATWPSIFRPWPATLPFVSAFFSRVGQVVGLQENAIRLLEMGELVLAFPEGMKAISKPFAQRYQLEPFGHGFMRLALRTQTPIVPVAVIGAEEQYLSFGNLEWAARALGLPAFPLLPQLLVPGGAMPLPTKYRIYFGEPMRFYG